MGISADQFWQTSQNGKAMVLMLATRGDVETARDICDWLLSQHKKDRIGMAMRAGSSKEQAEIVAADAVVGLQKIVDGINDRNCSGNVGTVIDAVFRRYYEAGKESYEKAMRWFADELRKRVKD